MNKYTVVAVLELDTAVKKVEAENEIAAAKKALVAWCKPNTLRVIMAYNNRSYIEELTLEDFAFNGMIIATIFKGEPNYTVPIYGEDLSKHYNV